MPFLRVFQHLLPRGQAWRTTIEKTLRKFFEGLTGLPEDAREYADLVWLDGFPDTTREIAEWEKHFGIQPTSSATENERRAALAAEWAATGGQSPTYIEGVLQTAGFDVYVHEWWSSGPNPYTARDPRDYTDIPLVGTVQCTGADLLAYQPQCTPPYDADGVPFTQHLCNRFLVNDPGYFANDNLTRVAPPPTPDDPARHRFFFYVGGETFGDAALVPLSRRAELRRLLLKMKPAQQWIVTFLAEGNLLAEDEDPLLTEDDENLVV